MKAVKIQKPCESSCPKCGSSAVSRTYREAHSEWEVEYRNKPRDNDFVSEDHRNGIAKQECISHRCRCCAHKWESDVIEKAEIAEIDEECPF